MNFIDCHSHLWTSDAGHYPLAPGFRRAQMEPASFTVEELWQHAQPAGIGRVVLIQISFYGYDNRFILEAIRAHPGRFSGVALINQMSPRPEEVMKGLKAQGVRGFRIYPKENPVEKWLDGEGLQAMLKCAAQERLNLCCLIDPDGLPALSRACEKYPEAPLVIDHLCRIGATTGKIEPSDVKALCGMARHKQVTLKVSGFYALGKKQPPYLDLDLVAVIREVFEAFGPQRLMWGSDSPYEIVHGGYQQSLDLIQNGLDFLSAADKEWILRKTAERVFFS